MVDVLTSFGAGVLATFVPLYIGLFAPRFLAGSSGSRPEVRVLLAAGSSGIMLWFLSDVLGDAARLNVDLGFDTDTILTHTLLALLFPVCLLALFSMERKFSGRDSKASRTSTGMSENSIGSTELGLSFAVAIVAGLAIGLHAVGEGAIIGQKLPSASSITDAFGGGVGAGVAYVLHKLLEGFVVGAFAVIAGVAATRKLGLLGLVSGLPTVVGFLIGLPFSSLDATYFFALGSAGSVYILLKLIPLYARQSLRYASVAAVLLGFFSMYFAGLFHAA